MFTNYSNIKLLIIREAEHECPHMRYVKRQSQTDWNKISSGKKALNF